MVRRKRRVPLRVRPAPMERISLRLPPGVCKQLRREAKRRRVKVSVVVRDAVADWSMWQTWREPGLPSPAWSAADEMRDMRARHRLYARSFKWETGND
jgi:predicted transcriptional regulator